MKFSIIIPTWNGKVFLKACFDSLKNQSFKDFEVILVDDFSTDDTIQYTKKYFPWVKIIEKSKNSGFPSSVNLGIKAAKGEFIALLNNDTEVDKDWLQNILNSATNHPEAGFFASKMLDFKDRSIIDSCGDGMTWSGRGYKIGELKKDSRKFETERYVFGACGGAAVYRKELFDRIGLFDEDFKFYLEDVDIDFRAQLAGYKCVFVPGAKVYHIGSATAGKRSSFSFKMMIKNHFHLILKNYPWQKIISNIFKLKYSELRFFAAAIKYHFVREYFWGVNQALLESPKMLPKRRRIQRNRKASLKELDQIIDPKFNYKSLSKAIKDAR